MTATRDIAATRQQVWDVLADGWTYSGWVPDTVQLLGVAPRNRECTLRLAMIAEDQEFGAPA